MTIEERVSNLNKIIEKINFYRIAKGNIDKDIEINEEIKKDLCDYVESKIKKLNQEKAPRKARKVKPKTEVVA